MHGSTIAPKHTHATRSLILTITPASGTRCTYVPILAVFHTFQIPVVRLTEGFGKVGTQIPSECCF
eukprot:1071551-Pyramimonas_sp.AAC.1